MLGGLDKDALAHQTRRIADFGDVAPDRGNLEIIQIRPPEDNTRARRSGQQAHAHGRPAVQTYAGEGDGRLNCLFQLC